MPDRAILQVQALSKRFGGVVAIKDLSFEVGSAAVVGVIGPNGSGKTTLLNMINGIYRPDGGDIRLDGSSIAGSPPHVLVSRGIARTFQNPRVFRTLTVTQNMLLPLLHRRGGSGKALPHVAELLELVGLEREANRPASELSGGQQKLLEFARALMTEPKVVLMDEPFAGVNPAIKRMLMDCIRATSGGSGTSFLIVSHEVPDLISLSQRMICLASGELMAEGPPPRVASSPAVIEAYLGRSRVGP